MNTNQKRTAVIASIIGTLLNCYEQKEQTALHRELHSRIGRGIRKQARKHSIAELMIVTYKDGSAIWEDAVGHFSEKEITIEASACVLSLWNMDEKRLTSDYGLSAKKIGEWAKPSKRENRRELELASREVAKYVWQAVNKLYGIEEEKKVSILERLGRK